MTAAPKPAFSEMRLPYARANVLYGLRVASEIPLHQDRPVADGDEPDVEIRQAQPVPRRDELPPGRVLAHLEMDQLYYTFVVDDDGGYMLRFYGTCDVVIDRGLRVARVHVMDGAEPGVAGVLVAGTVLSFMMTMRGFTVLHASAVQVGAAALAFVGRSGMGKSTMAALMCASGARLVTDDVLRAELVDDGAGVRCRLGATELRLRKAAAELAEHFSERPPSRVTGDARDALRMVEATDDHLPLSAIVIPLPDRELSSVRIARLDPMDALLALLRFPRLLGWTDASVLDRQFHQAGEIVERVPVFAAHVPWGPPFADDIVPSLLDAIGQSTR